MARFVLVTTATAVVPLLAYGAASMAAVQQEARQAALQGNLHAARQVASEIEYTVGGSLRALNAVGASLLVIDRASEELNPVLADFARRFPEFLEVALVADDGRPLAASPPGAFDSGISRSPGIWMDSRLTSWFAVDDDEPNAVAAVRLADAGRSTWLVGRLGLHELSRIVDHGRVGTQGYALVVDANGRLLADGDPSATAGVARRGDLRSHPLIAARRSRSAVNPPLSAEYEDSRRGALVGVAATVTPFDWTVIVEQPTAEAFAIPVTRLARLRVLLAAALLLTLAGGYVLVRTFVDPIHRLTDAAEALAAGQFHQRVAVTSTRGLGRLGAAVNGLAARLQNLQEDGERKEHLAALGRISLGLAHDLSAPIQNLGNASTMMTTHWNDPEYRRVFARTVERELAEIGRLLDDLRSMARPTGPDRAPIDVNQTIGDLVESMRATAEATGLAIEADLSPGPLQVDGHGSSLNRVVRNLLLNAVQATPAGGRVVVRTSRRQDRAVLEVTDTGCGIPEDRLATIFDDFATTRHHGLGLGLAVAKAMVERLNGTIAVTSCVGGGATFAVSLPLSRATPSSPDAT